jgi:hypothetical protein
MSSVSYGARGGLHQAWRMAEHMDAGTVGCGGGSTRGGWSAGQREGVQRSVGRDGPRRANTRAARVGCELGGRQRAPGYGEHIG